MAHRDSNGHATDDITWPRKIILVASGNCRQYQTSISWSQAARRPSFPSCTC